MNEIIGKVFPTWEQTQECAEAKLKRVLNLDIIVDDAGDVIFDYNGPNESIVGSIEFISDKTWKFIPVEEK